MKKLQFLNIDFHLQLVTRGFQQYSDLRGYSYKFACAGPHVDNRPFDHDGVRMSTMVSIDATDFSRTDPMRQYEKKAMDRELNKAFIGFMMNKHE